MAVFIDITGWEEELASFEKTPEGVEFSRTHNSGISISKPLIPLQELLELTELFLVQTELRVHLDTYVVWQKQFDDHPDWGDDHPDRLNPPFEANLLFRRFYRWYTFKKNTPYGDLGLQQSKDLGYLICVRDLPGLRHDATFSYISQNYRLAPAYGDGEAS